MAIDIYKKGQQSNRLLTVSDELYDGLDEGLIERFQKRTGVFIDNYGVCRLSFQHAATFAQMIKEGRENKELLDSDELKQLLSVLEYASKNEIDIDLVGD